MIIYFYRFAGCQFTSYIGTYCLVRITHLFVLEISKPMTQWNKSTMTRLRTWVESKIQSHNSCITTQNIHQNKHNFNALEMEQLLNEKRFECQIFCLVFYNALHGLGVYLGQVWHDFGSGLIIGMHGIKARTCEGSYNTRISRD